MSKKKKVINILFLIVFVSAIIFLVFRIILFPVAFYGVLYGEDIEDKLYSSASECIKDQIYINSKLYNDKTEYAKSIYIYENDKQYIEFFIDNEDSAWCYILDKNTNNDGKIEYSVNFSEYDIQYVDTWRSKSNFKYNVIQDKEDIENYEGREPEVIEFQLNYNDEIRTYYLLFIAADKQP